MKFKVFTIHEIIYKWVAYLSVFIFTVTCIIYFVKSNNKSGDLAFILSVLYALFLFVITVYMTSMSEKIRNLFYIRKGQYEQLLRLSEVSNTLDKTVEYESFSTIDNFLSNIFMFKSFTGRTDNEKIKPYIKQDGFSFTKKYLILEKSFIEQYKNLREDLNDNNSNYVDIHNKEVSSLSCDLKKKVNELDKIMEELKKNNIEINKNAQKNIKRIKRVYGKKLIESLNTENHFFTNFQVIGNQINELKDLIFTYVDVQEIIEEQFDVVTETLRQINLKLESIDENVLEILIE